ncbi:MAG: aminoacyl-tRNA hydrolase [Bacillota bacterium]
MKLIVGLGNPGKKYFNTRHNIGFRAVEKLARSYEIGPVARSSRALQAEGEIAGEAVVLAQPLTYMNRSGRAVSALLKSYQLFPRQMLVIYDDLDLPLAQLRIKKKGSSGGHNGLQSIIDRLETQEFPRLRIGIGRPPQGVDVVDYVLQGFDEQEQAVIGEAMEEVPEIIETIVVSGYAAAMNKYN